MLVPSISWLWVCCIRASYVVRITHKMVSYLHGCAERSSFFGCAQAPRKIHFGIKICSKHHEDACNSIFVCLKNGSKVPWLQSSISPSCNGHEMGLDFPLLNTSIVFCRSCNVPSYAHDIPAISCYIHISQSSIFAHCTSCFHISSYVRSPWFSWNGLEQKSLEQKRAVRSRFSHQVIKLKEVIKDKSGTVTKLKCSWAPQRMARRMAPWMAMDGLKNDVTSKHRGVFRWF